MQTQEMFEEWAKEDWPEIDLSKTQAGEYRSSSTRDKWAGYQAGRADGYMDGRADSDEQV